MDIWKFFEKFADSTSIKIAIVLSVLIIVLVIAFIPSAGGNILSVLLAAGTFAGASRIPRKRKRAIASQKKESLP